MLIATLCIRIVFYFNRVRILCFSKAITHYIIIIKSNQIIKIIIIKFNDFKHLFDNSLILNLRRTILTRFVNNRLSINLLKTHLN